MQSINYTSEVISQIVKNFLEGKSLKQIIKKLNRKELKEVIKFWFIAILSNYPLFPFKKEDKLNFFFRIMILLPDKFIKKLEKKLNITTFFDTLIELKKEDKDIYTDILIILLSDIITLIQLYTIDIFSIYDQISNKPIIFKDLITPPKEIM